MTLTWLLYELAVEDFLLPIYRIFCSTMFVIYSTEFHIHVFHSFVPFIKIAISTHSSKNNGRLEQITARPDFWTNQSKRNQTGVQYSKIRLCGYFAQNGHYKFQWMCRVAFDECEQLFQWTWISGNGHMTVCITASILIFQFATDDEDDLAEDDD